MYRQNSDVLYDSETITFAPKDTPILILDSENASIAYDSRGIAKLNMNDTARSTATVYFNGSAVSLPAKNFT
jgi:hypothetical protein